MFVDGAGRNGLMILCDARTNACTKVGGVLRLWSFGKACIGVPAWNDSLRVAIRDHKEAPLGAAALKLVKRELADVIKSYRINTILILQSPIQVGEKSVNNAWNIFRPGNPAGWSGTVHMAPEGVWLAPVLHPDVHEWAYHWLIRRWFIQALEVAKGRMRPRPWPTSTDIITEAGPAMLERLQAYISEPHIVIDIETNMAKTIISAIGLGNGKSAVSVPWDAFQIAGTDRYEPEAGADIKAATRAVLASSSSKVGQNLNFDVYQLEKRGLKVAGDVQDTLLMSHSVFPQFSKGLQQIAAMHMCIEPWKSLHKPETAPRGQNKKLYDKWLSTPLKTRIYNCKDVIATDWSYEALNAKLA